MISVSLMVDTRLCFEEPLTAARDFSADPTLKAKARLIDGRWVTALEHQALLLECTGALLEGDAASHVPGLRCVLDTWSRMLDAFHGDDRELPRVHPTARRPVSMTLWFGDEWEIAVSAANADSSIAGMPWLLGRIDSSA